jgi:UDP-N-acetylmuramoyl-tripeptide--D-alanyl-D-alanine ligase
MHAKTELFEEMTPNAISVINADDGFADAMAAKAPGPKLFFGIHEAADVRARSLMLGDDGCRFELVLPCETVAVRRRIPGRFMVANALAAATVGHALGLTGDRIRRGLEGAMPEKGRMTLVATPRNIRFIDDTYNANPASMKAAFQTLASMGGKGRDIAVLGDMLELGAQAGTLHREVGAAAAEAGIDRLYVTGEFADAMAEGAMASGMSASRIVCGAKDVLYNALTQALSEGDRVLVKGSRGMKMETLLGALREWAENH